MNTFLWILFGGMVIGTIGALIFLILKKRLVAFLFGCVAIVCIGSFILETSINPIANADLVSQTAEKLNFEDMINEFDTNEVRAEKTYKNNQYEITAEVASIEKAGLADGFSGYNVTMNVSAGNQIITISGNFQSNMEEEILKLNTGDMLTFTGRFVSPRIYESCTIVAVN